ncbi:hypothetical protein E2C01_008106 [Portunus trituberculatus]|uniref:Uncharacterized protein n=1 Tax=Portunus trituberculatus TaxID=210409 RepID=A0A5B7D0W4_PORTR|nr:hypothetical protein [Portunus trituberculatus]
MTASKRYVVGLESARGRVPDPMLTTLSTTPSPPCINVITVEYQVEMKPNWR